MSHRIFDMNQALQPNKTVRLKLWRNAQAGRSVDGILYGLVQLVLDVLETTCDDEDSNDDFTLPANIDGTTLGNFIVRVMNGKNFNVNLQNAQNEPLAKFIEMCVEQSETADWMPRMLNDCLCVLCANNATTSLVAKTMVDFYSQVIIKRHHTSRTIPFWHALGQIREQIYRFIVDLPIDAYDSMMAILNAFFKRLNATPEVSSYDDQGIGEIIGKFLTVDALDVNLKLMDDLLAFCKKHLDEYGADLLQLLANQPAVINALDSIIYDVKSVRAQRLALELAYEMQCEAPNRLFQDTFYKDCVFSEDETIRENVVKLYRISFRNSDTDETDANEILRHAVQLYRDHRSDYTTCAQRLTSAFYDEFTNWDAVFGLILQYMGEDYEFVEKMFHLLKFVYKYIKSATTQDELYKSEGLLREHAQQAILCLARINRETVHTDMVDHLIGAILHTDKELKLVRNSDCQTLATVIIAMSKEVNMARVYAAHMNMMLVMKCLYKKNYIDDETVKECVDECITERSVQQQQLNQRNINFDDIDTVLYTAMKFNVLTELELVSDERVMRQLCIDCDGILMEKSLDSLDSHTFLGYTILTLVRTHIFAYKKAGNQARRPADSVSSPSEICDRLFQILQNTSGVIDFLVEAIIWALCHLELYFLAVSEKKELNGMVDWVLQKVKLVEITPISAHHPVRDINLRQLKHVEYMLVEILKLLKVKRPLNVQELIVTLYMKFPDYHFAKDMMRYTIEANLCPMLTNAILDILNQLKKKTEKEKFIGSISSILTLMPSITSIQAAARKDGIDIRI